LEPAINDRLKSKYQKYKDVIEQSRHISSVQIRFRRVWWWGKKIVVVDMSSTNILNTKKRAEATK